MLAFLAGAGVGLGYGAGGGGFERAWQGLAEARSARRGEGCGGEFAVALAEAGEGAQGRELAHQRAVADAVPPALAEKGAQVDGLESGDIRKRRGTIEMLGEECGELAEIARIGFQRLGREAPLGRKVAEPVAAERVEIGHEGNMTLLP